MAADLGDDAFELVNTAGRRIRVGPAQLGGKQMSAAEDVQRQVAVTAVVAMEEAPFLLAVQRVVGGIQIEDDLVRCLLVRLDEARDEQRLEGRRIVSDLVIARTVLGVGGMFEPVQGRLARQRLAALAPSAELASQRSQHRVTAQLVVVVQVLVAERDPHDPLHHQRVHGVFDQLRIAPILEAGRHPFGQPQGAIDLAQQQRARIRADLPTVKIHRHLAALNAPRALASSGTLCRHRGFLRGMVKSFSQNNFLILPAAMRLLSVRNAG